MAMDSKRFGDKGGDLFTKMGPASSRTYRQQAADVMSQMSPNSKTDKPSKLVSDTAKVIQKKDLTKRLKNQSRIK